MIKKWRRSRRLRRHKLCREIAQAVERGLSSGEFLKFIADPGTPERRQGAVWQRQIIPNKDDEEYLVHLWQTALGEFRLLCTFTAPLAVFLARATDTTCIRYVSTIDQDRIEQGGVEFASHFTQIAEKIVVQINRCQDLSQAERNRLLGAINDDSRFTTALRRVWRRRRIPELNHQ